MAESGVVQMWQPEPVPLASLIAPLLTKRVEGDPHVVVRGLSIDSRTAQPGDLFIALNEPEMADRHAFAADAAARGAVALLVERFLPECAALPRAPVQVLVPDILLAAGLVAAQFYGHPSRRLRLLGVTGTKGKSTVTHLIYQILTACGETSGLMGTTGVRAGTQEIGAVNTTPHAPELQRLLAWMARLGVGPVAMEVSSHALRLHRVAGCEFHVGVFTNLSQDHLNFHADMDDYAQAKSLLFAHLGSGVDPVRPRVAVINVDSPYSELMRKATNVECLTYGLERPALLTARDLDLRPDGSSFTVDGAFGTARVETRLAGRFNVYNCLAAIGACLAHGRGLEEVAAALRTARAAPGRLEPVDTGGRGFAVYVDYAHTPDSLEKVLETVRAMAPARVICVFGCGGNRDRGKRPVMGRIAVRLSDLTVITSDNPRREPPGAILDDIEAGIREATKARGPYVRIEDRREAIAYALRQARPGDIVLIAGKGHETYQIIGDQRLPFDDRAVAREVLATLPVPAPGNPPGTP